MQPDSQFVDNYVAAVQDEPLAEVHDVWVDFRLAQDFMRNANATLSSGVLVVLMTTALLYGHVNELGLALWALASSFFVGYRYFTVKAFERLMKQHALNGATPDVTAFFKKHGWSWPASATAFAFPVFLYFENAPEVIQYLCLLILAGMGAVGASLMAARLSCQRQFSHGLCGTAALAVAITAGLQLPKPPANTTWIFLFMVGLFWFLILYIGRHFHVLQRSSYSAQFGNEQLIRSLRQQTQSATEAVQMKNNLLASAAHDLRQPVHALAFYADWLRNEPTLAASVIPKILAATDSVNTLFNSLFDFARIESGAIKINMESVDIVALMNDMAVQFAPAAQAKGLALQTRPLNVSVHSDSVLLRRITGNLIANAIRYTDQGGVVVAARVAGDKLWLEISDSGSGIAPEHLPHVFKEFYRAPINQGTADSFGLGLAIVQRLCRALGHTVSIRSVIGKGTRCRLELDVVGALAVPSEV